MAVPKKVLKRQTLRNIEYYGLQEIFDELYQKSLENRKFRNLMELILMEENIKLAYRNMKKNDGSTTPGVDGKTIEHLAKMTEKEVIELVRNKLEWYTPKAILNKYKLESNQRRKVNTIRKNAGLEEIDVKALDKEL